MFNPLKFKCTSVVGIDINCIGVSLIEISSHNGTYCIEGFARETLPLGALEGNAIKDSHVVSECLKRAVENGHIRSKQAVVAIPDAAVITKTISINVGLSEREIEEFITIESDLYAPYPSHELHIDFQRIGPSISQMAMQDVRVFVSRTETVNERVSVVNQSGLEVKIVDIESHAIQRSAQWLVKKLAVEGPADGKLDAIVALIDIGALETNLFIFQGMDVIFTRAEEFGSQSLIAAFAHSNLGTLACDNLAWWGEPTNSQPLMEVLLLQIKRMLQFFFATSHHQRIDKIILAGEIARAPSLQLFMQKKMEVVTIIANPLSYFKMNKNLDNQVLIEISPSMMRACGLALRRLN